MYQFATLKIFFLSLVALTLGESEVGSVFQGLQWKRIELLNLGSKSNITSIQDIIKDASSANVLVSGMYSYASGKWKTRLFPFEALVCICDDTDGLINFRDVLRNAKFSPERIMLLTRFEFEHSATFFQSLNMSRSFFWHEYGLSSASIKRIHTVRERPIFISNVWHKQRGIYDRQYNFQGAPFMVFAPARDYYAFTEPMTYNLCPENPIKACNVSGPEVRLINMLQRRLNFTLEIYLEKNNDWGTAPSSGKFGDENATYTGVLGGIVHDKYDMATSFWMPLSERRSVLEFSTPYHYFTSGFVMATGATGLDWDLYLRPFTKSLWAACAALVLVTFLAYLLTRWKANKDHRFDAMRVVIFWGCLSFVVIKVYYEGALTMFFTTTNKIKPNSIDDVIFMYPKYKLIMFAGSEGLIQHYAKFSPGYKKYLELIQEDEELIQPGYSDILEQLRKPGRVAALGLERFQFFLTIMHVDLEVVQLFHTIRQAYSRLLPKRSPWIQAINLELQYQHSSGLLTKARTSSQGIKRDTNQPSTNKVVLDSGQVSLVFIMHFLAACVALIILIWEKIRARIIVREDVARSNIEDYIPPFARYDNGDSFK